ncbi:pilus assembly protein TadG-related protein [Caenispirillum salinarum]|uniref:pilus assembly protein TadG-related protein n=1 Tax=Caenispirillum salinarum TaxID=859058 RepID=UPI0038501C2A
MSRRAPKNLAALVRRIRSLPADRQGSVAIMVGLAFPVLAGMGFLAVDVGAWYWERRNLQTAADAAALSGAFAQFDGLDAEAAATADAASNGFDSVNGTITVGAPASGTGAGDPGAVEVVLTQPLPLFYAQVMGETDASVTVSARATMAEVGEYCVLGLDRNNPNTVEVTGNGSMLMTCGVAVNSISDSALYLGGSATIEATTASVTGGIEINGSPTTTWTEGPPLTGRQPVKDPYEHLDAPPPGACEASNLTVSPSDSVVLDAGSDGTMTVCGGIDVKGTLHFTPGTYILDGGEFRANSGAVITGDDVTLIFTGQGTDYATVNINGGAEVDLRAPTSGAWEDIVLFQDPDAPSSKNGSVISNTLNGTGSLNLEGVVYFPSQKVDVIGTGDSTNGCMNLVALQVSFSGNSAVVNSCPTRDLKKISAYKVTLIQ